VVVKSYETTIALQEEKKEHVVAEDDDEACCSNKNDFIKDDDGYSELSPEHYMNVRIQTFYAKQSARIQWWQTIQDCSEQGIQILMLGTSVTALISYQWTIPIIMAVAAALTNVLEIGDYRKSIASARLILQQLDDLQKRYKMMTTRSNQKRKENAEFQTNNNIDDNRQLTLPNDEAWDSLVEVAEAIILKAEL
jgi:hypothetical protein